MSVVGVKVGLVLAELLWNVVTANVFDVGLFIKPGAAGLFEFLESGGPVCCGFSGVYFEELE